MADKKQLKGIRIRGEFTVHVDEIILYDPEETMLAFTNRVEKHITINAASLVKESAQHNIHNLTYRFFYEG